jgi:hypothetical protein
MGGGVVVSIEERDGDPGTPSKLHTLAICCFCWSCAGGGLYATIWNLLVVKQVKEDEGGGGEKLFPAQRRRRRQT